MPTIKFTLFSHAGFMARAVIALPMVVAMAAPALLSAQVSNNACTAAAANRYPVNTSCTPIAFNKPTSYTATFNPGGCGAGNYDDAWGSFIATGTVTTVQYTPTGGTNAILHVLASCTGPVLGCADDVGNNSTETVTIETVPGTTYYVRVQRKNSNSAMNGTLCVFTSGDCLYDLHLYDSYGNGWNGYGGTAYVQLKINGVLIGNYTLTNAAHGIFTLPLFSGDIIEITYYSNGHLYVNENSYVLTPHGQEECLHVSSSPPPNGVATTITVSCPGTMLNALPQDCRGGTTICSNASITSNSTGLGCTLDLNASNRGCLLSEEMQGSWYYFSPTSSGTLGFTLTPHNPYDDYDFALWGPYNTAQCPTGAPARCSYFDGNGTNNNQTNTATGMGNGANDTSEGAYAPPASNNGWVKTMDVVAGKVYVLYVDNWSVSGQAFDLAWNLTGGASLNCVTLPVELLALEAKPYEQVIFVDWTTATEHGADYFEVQRSDDNNNFTAIGQVNAVGDALFPNDYRFTDTAPLRGANYYRLRQVDRDGAFELSRSVVAFMNGNGQRPALFPNPAHETLQIGYFAPQDGTVSFQVLDALGRIAVVHDRVAVRGDQATTIPVQYLAKGWYSVRVVLPDGTALLSSGFLKQ